MKKYLIALLTITLLTVTPLSFNADTEIETFGKTEYDRQ